MSGSLTEIANELYSLSPEKFTATRNERAKALAASGERDAAATVRALPKPSASAWATNMLARHSAAEVRQLRELGASLREAQADLDRESMQLLGQQRRQVVAALARRAAELAEGLGHPVGPSAVTEIEQTLQAALADEDAAAAVSSGRLLHALSPGGFDAVELTGAVAVPEAPPAPGTQPSARSSRTPRAGAANRELVAAGRDLRAAQRDATNARSEREVLDRKAERAESARRQTEELVNSLRRQLADAEQELTSARHTAAALASQLEEAERAASEADAALSAAEARVQRLSEANEKRST